VRAEIERNINQTIVSFAYITGHEEVYAMLPNLEYYKILNNPESQEEAVKNLIYLKITKELMPYEKSYYIKSQNEQKTINECITKKVQAMIELVT